MADGKTRKTRTIFLTRNGAALIAASISLAVPAILFADPLITTAVIVLISLLLAELAWVSLVMKNPTRWISIEHVNNNDDDNKPQQLPRAARIQSVLYPDIAVVNQLRLLSRRGRIINVHRLVSISADIDFLKIEIDGTRLKSTDQKVDKGEGAQKIDKDDELVVFVTARFTSPFAGRYATNHLSTSMLGPLALFRFTALVPVSLSYTVYPRLAQVALASASLLLSRSIAGEASADAPGSGTEFYDMRRYQSGDDFRQINWKATARRGELMVIERARELGASCMLVLDASALYHSDRDRLASTFLQIANLLSRQRIRFGIMVHRADGRVMAFKRINDDEDDDALAFALRHAIEFSELKESDVPEELLDALPSANLKRLRDILRASELEVLSKIAESGYQGSLNAPKQLEAFRVLEAEVLRSDETQSDSTSFKKSILYVTGIFGSLTPLLEFASRIRLYHASCEFTVINPTRPWVSARNEQLAVSAYRKYSKNLRALASAKVVYRVGDPIKIAEGVAFAPA